MLTNKPLLVVLSHSGANETVSRHWPWYARGEADILGVGRQGTKCEWPPYEGFTGHHGFIGSIDIGQESYANGSNHNERLLAVLNHCVKKTRYTSFCVIEYDCLLFKPLIFNEPGAWFISTPAGGKSPGFSGTRFYHCPWWFSREMAIQVLDWGDRMLSAGLIEQGFIDRWLGLMSDLYPMQLTNSGWYSRNTIGLENVAEARTAIAAGAHGVHGVKTAEVLEALTT